MEALLKLDVACPRALASHGGRVIFGGGGCLNYVPFPIPTIPTLRIRLVNHHVLPLFLKPPPPLGTLPPPPLTLWPSLFPSPSPSPPGASPSCAFFFLFFRSVVYRRSLRLAPRPEVAELLLLLLPLLEVLLLELL